MKYCCCRSEVTIKVCFQSPIDCDSPLILKESFHYAYIAEIIVVQEHMAHNHTSLAK